MKTFTASTLGKLLMTGALMLAGACGDDSQPPDAAADRPNPDAAVDAPIDAPVDAPPDAVPDSGIDAAIDAGSRACSDGGAGAGPRTVYFNFDGALLVAGNCSDALTNCTFLVSSTTSAGVFAPSRPDRAAFIAAIVADVEQQLAPYNAQIVTTRPTSGNYSMIMFTQCVSTLSCQSSTFALGPLDCGNVNPVDIGFVFESTDASTPATAYARAAVYAIGFSIGVGKTQIVGDCMDETLDSTWLCTFGINVPIAPGIPSTDCNGTGFQNEDSVFAAVFGCR